jgi:hypothetical protein
MARNHAAQSDLESESTALRAASAEAVELSRVVRRWREHLSETQAFVRLALSFLQSSWPNAEQRAHVGSLLAVEARTLAMLPQLDVSDLHTGLTPDQSGITPVRPDAMRASHYLRSLRERATAWLRALSTASASGVALTPLVRAIDGVTTEMLSAIELLELFLFARANAPLIQCSDAISRAANAVHRKVSIESSSEPAVLHVRGLLRLIGAIITDAEDGATVKLSQTNTRAVIEVPVTRDQHSDERAAFLKFCAYLGRMHCERDGVRTRLIVPLAVA